MTRPVPAVRRARVAAAVSALATSAVIVFMDWVPTPLNRNLATASVQARLPGTLVHAATGLTVAAFHVVGGRRLALVGAAWYSGVALSAATNWWLPYLFDVTVGEVDAATFAAEYAANVTVLPRVGDHVVVPDLQHLLIHVGVGLSCVLAWRSYAVQRRCKRREESGRHGSNLVSARA